MKIILILVTLIMGCAHKDYSVVKKTKKFIPMNDFFENPKMAGFTLSPSGKFMLYRRPYLHQMNLFIQPTSEVLAGTKKGIQQLTFFSQQDRWVKKTYFLNDKTVLFTQDNFGDENYVIYKIDIPSRKIKQLTPKYGITDLPENSPKRKKGLTKYNTRAFVLDELVDRPNHIMIGMNKRTPFSRDVYLLNIKTRRYKMIQKNPGDILYYQPDWKGELRLGYKMQGLNRTIVFKGQGSEKFIDKVKFTYADTFTPIQFDNKNPNLMYVYSNLPKDNGEKRDKVELIVYDFEKNKEVETLFKLSDYDAEGEIVFSNKRKVPLFILYTTHKRLYKFLDDTMEKHMENMYDQVEKLGFREEVRIQSMNKNEDRFIVTSFSDRNFGNTYIYDTKKEQLKLFYKVNTKINPKDLVEMKPYSFKSSDGKFKIHGYLTLPYGLTKYSANNIPIVVHPHGGPWVRDTWGYNPIIQFLANRGYGVLQVNFRGSTGYGKKFLEASYKQWGQAMQQDVTDGVKELISDGIANKNNICIYGASYGGYSTLAGVTYTPELYRCGIDAFGPSNLITHLKSYPPQWVLFKKQATKKIGDLKSKKDLAMLKKYSPFFHANKIKAAMLIAQGGKDVRVKRHESEQIVSVLKKNKVPYEYFYREKEGHGFTQRSNRFAFYKRIELFLHQYINGRIE